MKCTARLPWPCEKETVGGSHALGSVLCARHLAGVLAPLRPPDIDRVALRRYFRAVTESSKTVDKSVTPLDPETAAAIVALAPLGAALYYWKPRYEPRSVRMTVGTPGKQARTIGANDAVMPRTARAAMLKAAHSGWDARATAVGDMHVLLRCWRGDALVAMTWLDGKFATAWCRQTGDLQQLGYRDACRVLDAP